MSKKLTAKQIISKLKHDKIYDKEVIDVLETSIKRLDGILTGRIRLSVKSGENYVAIPKYQYENSEKELKAFDIIKEKGVAVGMLQLKEVDLNEYNNFIGDKKLYLTQEEYDLLKEVLL